MPLRSWASRARPLRTWASRSGREEGSVVEEDDDEEDDDEEEEGEEGTEEVEDEEAPGEEEGEDDDASSCCCAWCRSSCSLTVPASSPTDLSAMMPVAVGSCGIDPADSGGVASSAGGGLAPALALWCW